jgi:hypothetical protein
MEARRKQDSTLKYDGLHTKGLTLQLRSQMWRPSYYNERTDFLTAVCIRTTGPKRVHRTYEAVAVVTHKEKNGKVGGGGGNVTREG